MVQDGSVPDLHPGDTALTLWRSESEQVRLLSQPDADQLNVDVKRVQASESQVRPD